MAKKLKPAQHQKRQPGDEGEMTPRPESIRKNYRGSGKLKNKVAIITGGDSGIGRSIAYHFAAEGANIALLYLDEHKDAKETQKEVRRYGRECKLFPGDIGDQAYCQKTVKKILKEFGSIDIVVNNAAEQHSQTEIENITASQLENTFRTNFFGLFYLTQASVKEMKEGGCVINTTSVTAYRGSPHLIDYAATKGAIVAFTRSLSGMLVKRGIRVNAVAPGPIWTPLIPATFEEERVAEFGEKVPMERPGEPSEVGPCYVFLASLDASYMTGQVLHPNGGEVLNT